MAAQTPTKKALNSRSLTTSQAVAEKPPFSWRSELPSPPAAPCLASSSARCLAGADKTHSQPHPLFVIILVGSNERPFGIQKDFLCARSEFYRRYFAERGPDESVEHLVRLPSCTEEVFGLAQNFLFTGMLPLEQDEVSSYESLVGLWNLGHQLGIKGLCEKTLEAMVECRRLTDRILTTPLLVKVWADTTEGSSIRALLLSWAAEYMRYSDSRAEFAKSLPQEVLSELVVAMSSFDASPAPDGSRVTESPPVTAAASLFRKNSDQLADTGDEVGRGTRKRRPSTNTPKQAEVARRMAHRTPLPKPHKQRSNMASSEERAFTKSRKLEFCADLLNRMLSGPGFWTRLIGPFKDPVRPEEDGVPDYLDRIKRPMDLGTIKAKMDRHEYEDKDEFLADVRQIFDNCFMYWNKGDPLWSAGEKLQKTFEDKYSHMHKWLVRMGGNEGE